MVYLKATNKKLYVSEIQSDDYIVTPIRWGTKQNAKPLDKPQAQSLQKALIYRHIDTIIVNAE